MLDLRKGTCPLCKHNEILESAVAEFASTDLEKPMCVTYDRRWVNQGRNPRYGHGPLFMYVCRSCGYVQWFANDPGTIPVDEEMRTRVIRGPDNKEPYR